MEPRQYQHEGRDQIRAAYAAGYKSVLYVLPTGGGKTVVFGDIARRVAERGKSVTVLVHRQELLRQASDKLTAAGVPHGIIAPGHTMTADAVQVASVATLARRLDRASCPSLVIIDEAHHAQATTWRTILSRWSSAHILGVTATPCRLDGKGLGRAAGGHFDCMVIGPSISNLIRQGYLVRPLVYGPPAGIGQAVDEALGAVHTRCGDYVSGELTAAIDKPKITGSAIDHYIKICPTVPAIAFCVSVKHAAHVAEQFRAAGIPADVLSGDLPGSIRTYRSGALASGALRVVTTCDLISEGYDVPACGCVICLRPTKSTGLALQQWGRALRPYPGKSAAIILDHVGNCHRHGLPDDAREWTLDGSVRRGKSAAGSPSVRQCEQCYAVFASGRLQCPQCGWLVASGSTPREIEEVEGELRLIRSDDEARMESVRKRREERAADSLEGLLDIARRRGYNPQWAYIRWQLKRSRNQLRLAI